MFCLYICSLNFALFVFRLPIPLTCQSCYLRGRSPGCCDWILPSTVWMGKRYNYTGPREDWWGYTLAHVRIDWNLQTFIHRNYNVKGKSPSLSGLNRERTQNRIQAVRESSSGSDMGQTNAFKTHESSFSQSGYRVFFVNPKWYWAEVSIPKYKGPPRWALDPTGCCWRPFINL